MAQQGHSDDSFGYGLTNSGMGNTMDVADELFKLEGFPETDIEYDDIDDEGIEIRFGEDEAASETAVAPQCQASTNSGEQCPNDVKVPESDPRVCVNHRHKIEQRHNKQTARGRADEGSDD